jgi:hypothetical protein
MPNTLATYSIGKLDVVILFEDSAPAQHPSVTFSAPSGYRIIGGGAKVQWQDPQPGALLTAMYPSDDGTTWTAASKDHSVPFSHVVTGYAICVTSKLRSHINDQEYIILSDESNLTAHPVETVKLPDGYQLLGGGARANYHGNGQLLTASFPQNGNTWYGESKDHQVSDPATLTVWAIGLKKSFLAEHGVTLMPMAVNASPAVSHPSSTAPASATEGLLLGGGAYDQYHGFGNLLTASYPLNNRQWAAAGKDHVVGDPAVMVAYALLGK